MKESRSLRKQTEEPVVMMHPRSQSMSSVTDRGLPRRTMPTTCVTTPFQICTNRHSFIHPTLFLSCLPSHQANPSADEYFEQQKDRFLGLLQHLQAVQSSLKRHASLLTQFVGSASQLGVDIRYTRIHHQCVLRSWSHAISSVVQGSGEDAFSTAMASQEAQMTDADATLRGALRILEGRIQHMKSFHRGDTSALEAKAMEARVAMDACTLGLYRVFAKYEADRRSMLHTELDMVTNVILAVESSM
ncbi:hypothetical protein DYB37_010115 [Aphanomyces astaci]|uniref:Uncharacterized protein n=1 Tax=Aphanomyces astaci TaxID=112090 RepID=A0A3R6Y5D9_APHAT|nr:hypothetical protein DYB35_008359 [Aphanomyces astaci]RHZ14832.1 hypothetical protein DYB37_010115 [Aphanomyces astaci]